MSSGQLPDPEDLVVPDVDTLDRLRERYGFSMNEFSERAGYERQRWSHITRRDTDPQLTTIQQFWKVLREADPDGPRSKSGGKPRCEIRGDGCGRGGNR